MGIIANMLIPGRRSQGFIITCVMGIAGAAVLCLAPIGTIQRVPPVRPPLSRLRVMRGDRARRLGAAALRNGGCPGSEAP